MSKSLSSPLIPRGATVLQVAALVRQADALALAQALQQKKFPAFVLTPGADHFTACRWDRTPTRSPPIAPGRSSKARASSPSSSANVRRSAGKAKPGVQPRESDTDRAKRLLPPLAHSALVRRRTGAGLCFSQLQRAAARLGVGGRADLGFARRGTRRSGAVRISLRRGVLHLFASVGCTRCCGSTGRCRVGRPRA